MRLLGEYLHQQGLTVLGVRLAGHGTTPQDLNETKWQDWYKAVSDGVYRLQAGCDRVSIVGLSMGGLLTIKAAAELPVAKAAILAAPIYVCDRRAPYLPLLRFFYPLPEKTSAPVSGASKLQRLLSYDAGQAAEQPV